MIQRKANECSFQSLPRYGWNFALLGGLQALEAVLKKNDEN